MALKPSGEMYLETIYVLSKEKSAVRSIDIAEHMNYSKPSVSRAVARLKEEGYITVDEHGHIVLTESGRAVANKIYERHTVLSRVLMALGVDEETGNGYIEKILAAIDEAGVTERCVINSFTAPIHEYIQDKYPGKYKHHVFWPDKNNLRATRDSYSYAYCCCLFNTANHLPAPEVFDFMRYRNIQPWAGASINCDERVALAIERGCTLITCNNPDVILECLRKRGYHK